MSAIANIGNSGALGYDLAEKLLASGAPLASVYALYSAIPVDSNDSGPISTRPTEYPATVRPGKAA
jgi:hypothetical protein